MAKVESKTEMSLDVKVKAITGETLGWFLLTSGNISYYRKHAKNETASYTYQQLMALIEKDIEEK